MTPRALRRKQRYRTDPEYRAKILESNRRSKATDPNPHRKRIAILDRRIYYWRNAIADRQAWLERADRKLLRMVEERERLKAISPKRPRGGRAILKATQNGSTCN